MLEVSQAGQRPLVTIAVPVFNEEPNLPELRQRLEAMMASVADRYRFEVLLINNGSVDRSANVCKQFCRENPTFKFLGFTRNFGIEASFLAGSRFASGDALMYLFSDLQDPVELIPEFLQKWSEGYEVVYGELQSREDQNYLKTVGAHLAYRLIFWMSGALIPINATDFRLMSRPVIDAVNRCTERNRYMRGLVHWSGFSQIAIPFNRVPRKRGQSSQGLIFCIQYALNAVRSFSTKPLKLASIAGILATVASFFGGLIWIAITILSRRGLIGITPPPTGWTTLALLIFFFGGIQCLFMGIIGHYLANVSEEVKARPHWNLRETVGLDLVPRGQRDAESLDVNGPLFQ